MKLQLQDADTLYSIELTKVLLWETPRLALFHQDTYAFATGVSLSANRLCA